MYLDAGSGARYAIPPKLIQAVRHSVEVPIIVGGGIRTPEAAADAARAGADVVVVGNALEDDLNLLREFTLAVHAASPGTPVATRSGSPSPETDNREWGENR